MLVSDYILKFLLSKGVKKVFLLTGGAIAFTVDAFARNKNISYVSVAHEQAAAMMADSYSRLGPNFAATMVTSGPGATNLLTGIACSWFDSIPNIHICGQVNTFETSEYNKSTKNVRQVGFQETDIVSMAKPITKFSYRVKNSSEVPYILEKAYEISTSERPGPVLVDIPIDIQKQKLNKIKLIKKKFIFKKKLKKKNFKYEKLIKLLNDSKRPCLILGGGIRISKAKLQLDNLLKKIDIPILTTWSGLDSIEHNHKNYMGTIGVYGSRAANFIVQNSDFVLNLGSRLDTRITGGKPETFARKAKIVSVDVDKFELNKKRGLKNFLSFNEDLKIFLNNLIKKISKKKINVNQDWKSKCFNWRNNYPMILNQYKMQKKNVNPYHFIDILSDVLTSKDIIIADDGAHLTWSVQAFKLKKGQRFFSAFGNSPMGYAFPASIGAAISSKKSRVICLDGDGSIQINIQELHTLKKLNLPVKIFILNNNGYGIIKQFQSLYLNSRYEATGKGVSNPDFKKVSRAYDIPYVKLVNHKNLKNKLKKILKRKGPEVIDVSINQEQKIIPKLEYGRPIEDLSPLLNDIEFSKNMLISHLRKKSKKNKNFTDIN